MGWIRCTRIEIVATLSELVGYKAGLALTQQDIMDQLPEERDLWAGLDDRTVRLHSSMYEGLLTRLLYRIGNIETPTVLFPGIGIYHMYKDDPEMMVVWTDLLELWNHRLLELVEKASQDKSPVDLMPFVETTAERYRTPRARKMLLEFLDEVALYLHSSLSLNIRRLEWIDVVALTGLFKSESLETYYGTFFGLSPRDAQRVWLSVIDTAGGVGSSKRLRLKERACGEIAVP